MGTVNKKTDSNESTALGLLSGNSSITDHLRALKRIHFIRLLDKGKVERLIQFRQEYKVTYEWKEKIRKRYEQMLYSKKPISNFLDDDVSDYTYNERHSSLYKRIRGVSPSDNFIDTKDILLLQYIAIEHYLAYGAGLKKRSKEDKLRDMLMVENGDVFFKAMINLGEELQIKYTYEGIEEPSSVVRHVSEKYEGINPAVKEYVFNTEAPLLQENFEACFKVLNKGMHTLLLDGLYLPFERFQKLKEAEFIKLCSSLYREYEKLFDEREGLSSEKIIAYINTYLIREIDDLSPVVIGAQFSKGRHETADKTVNAEIHKIEKFLGIDSISPKKHRSNKFKPKNS